MLFMMLVTKIKSNNHNINLYIPLILVFILYLIIAVFCLIAYPFLFLNYKKTVLPRWYLKVFFYLPKLISSAKGTYVEVISEEDNIEFYLK